MELDVFNNKILIVKDCVKKSLLKLINNEHRLLNIKIITLSELKKKYYFDYDKRAIYYLCNKYKIVSDIAIMYLDNLYYCNSLDNEKINFLNKIREELDKNELLIYNELFKKYLTNKDIVLYELDYVDLFYKNIFDQLKKNNNVEYYCLKKDCSRKSLFKAHDKEEEVSFVCSEICKLIKSGVDINNIKIANLNSDYYFTVKKIFKMFNIPINICSCGTIKGSILVKVFKDNYSSDINNTLSILSTHISNLDEELIYKKIVNIINSYSFCDDYLSVKELVIEEVENIEVPIKRLSNAVEVIDIENDIVLDNYHVFLINFNEGVVPISYKDTEYLSDGIREKINISTSKDKNINSILNLKEKIKNTNNLVVTYSGYNLNEELYVSSSYDEELFENKELKIEFNNSNKYNKLKLLSLKDENNKYGTISEELMILSSNYKNENYLDYSNKYSFIDKNNLYDYLGKKLTLSYSSVNSYYECGFKYYLNNVLKLNKYEDSFEIIIGNLFHKILSICFNDNFDFDKSWELCIEELDFNFSSKDKFFIDKLKSDLLLIIETIKKQMKYTQLDKTMYEKEIKIQINKELNITFKGFVDKIMYKELEHECIVAIIDYKTGNPNININNSIYGLDLQLPVYMYLIKNSKLFNNVRIGGFYLQKILSGNKEDMENDLKLQGYSNSDLKVLEMIDSSYMDSKIIKSMKTSSNGFYAYSKVINDDEIDSLSNIVLDKINASSNDILNAKFDINPKQINGVNKSCTYCKYKDICYMRNEDIISLPISKDIFGGEYNA